MRTPPRSPPARRPRRRAVGLVLARDQAQVRHWRDAGRPAFAIDPLALARGEPVAATRSPGREARSPSEPVLVYATAAAGSCRRCRPSSARRRPARWSRHAWRRSRAALGRARRAPARRGRRRNLRRGRAGARRDAAAHRRDDRPRRAVDAGRGDRPLLLALKSGNFGSADFFDKALPAEPPGRPATRTRCARCARCMRRLAPRDLPRRPLAVRARLRARHGRQHQRAAADGRLPDHADRRLPRLSRARAARARRRRRARSSAATAPARRSRCTGASTTPTPTRAA